MNMYESIFVRKSVKKFIIDELEQSLLDSILQYANELPLITDSKVEYRILSRTEDKKLQSKLGAIKAPYYFVIACENETDALLNAGYLMEQMVLYMTSRGLGTSYMIHLNHAKITGFELTPVIAVAFGHTTQTMYRDSRKSHRLPEKEVAIYKAEVSNDVKLMVRAARIAPSYMNSQPWRLVIYDNRIHIFCRKFVVVDEAFHEKKMLDIGIMVANIMLVAEELWIDVQIENMENLNSKFFKNNDYVFTILIGKDVRAEL